jgi:hypothetical protein
VTAPLAPELPPSLSALIERIFGKDFLVSHSRLAKGLGKKPLSLKALGDSGALPYRLDGVHRVYAREDVAVYLGRGKQKKKRSSVGFIYFVYVGSRNSLKIGFTTDVPRRLAEFRTSNRFVSLILHVEGSREQEKRVHAALYPCRIEREIFRAKDPKVQSFIDCVREEGLESALEPYERVDVQAPAAEARMFPEAR